MISILQIGSNICIIIFNFSIDNALLLIFDRKLYKSDLRAVTDKKNTVRLLLLLLLLFLIYADIAHLYILVCVLEMLLTT